MFSRATIELVHPRTGEVIKPLWVRPDGRACWPIMGASEDDGDDGDQGNDAGSAGDSDAGSDGDKGFPENTPVADMTPEQQAAYYKATSRKHEGRSKEWQQTFGGKTPAEIKAALEAAEQLRQQNLSDADRALETARSEARQEAAKEFGNRLVAAEFKVALAHVDGERRDQIIEGLALSSYLTSDGSVDTDKVKSFAAAIAPAATDEGTGRHDYGAGRRAGQIKSGVSAGAALFTDARKKSTSNADS